MATKNNQQETSADTKTIVTVLLLIFFFPIGLILMWFWTKWPTWVKVVVSLPIVLGAIAVLSAVLLVAKSAVNYGQQYNKNQETGRMVFAEINSVRSNAKLGALNKNETLCNYGDATAIDFAKTNQVDSILLNKDIKGSANASVLAEFQQVYEDGYSQTSNSSLSNVSQAFTGQGSVAMRPELSEGCVQMENSDFGKSFFVFIGGSK